MAIAVPTFPGTTGAADDRSSQSDLVTAITEVKVQFQSDGQTFDVKGQSNAGLLATALEGAQIDLASKAGSLGQSIALGSPGSASDISVSVSSDGSGVVLAAFSVPGNCFYVVDNAVVLRPAVAATNPYVGSSRSRRRASRCRGPSDYRRGPARPT
jgi:hypothetical protein